MKLEFKGVWFFGLSGSGKTFASRILNKKLDNSFIIDGDEVRKHVSFDLGYSKIDRNKQLERLIGLNKIVLRNKLFPICSSVIMTEKISEACKNENIKVLQILRSFDQIQKVRKIYDLDHNVVGKDIKQPEIITDKIFNDGNVFLFKDQNNNESVFNELSIETFIKGEAFSSKEPHTLTYDENSTFYWLSGNYKIIYKGVVTKLNNTDEANKIKKELCLASKFPIPNGKGSMTSINLDKKSEWYNKKQTMSGTFKMWTEHGVMKKYIDDDLISEGNYTNGKKDGLFKIFNEDGTIEDEILFKDGIEQINKKWFFYF